MTAPCESKRPARSLFSGGSSGLTLLELMTVIAIIAILALLLLPAVGWYQLRARRIACGENLKGLYVATTAHLNSNGGVWPQIKWVTGEEQRYAREWFEVLSPYGIAWKNLACPGVQAKMNNPDTSVFKSNRMDYTTTPFPEQAWIARKWPRQPWFAERQDVHSGNLFILANGSLMDITEARKIATEPRDFRH